MKKILKYLPFLPAVFGVLALIMIFLPAITIEIEALDKTYNYNGLTTVFGSEKDGFAFSFMNLLTYLLVIAAIACNVIGVLKKKQIFSYVVVACFLLATIFFFCTVSFVSFVEGASYMEDAFKEMSDLGVGSILAGVFGILGTLISALAALGGILAKKYINNAQN